MLCFKFSVWVFFWYARSKQMSSGQTLGVKAQRFRGHTSPHRNVKELIQEMSWRGQRNDEDLNNKPLQLGDGRSGWRENQHLIDALPYADILAPKEKAKAEQLIKEEMHRGRKRKKDYVDQLPAVQKLKLGQYPVIQQELKRLEQKQTMPKLDMSRYNMEPPPTTRQWEAQSWQHAVDNARSQLEHQFNRISNLELLLKYGVNTWRVQNKLVAEMLDRDFQWQKQEVERINRERKLGQLEGGKEVRQLEQEWNSQVHKSSQMLVAMKQLQWEIEDQRRLCSERGILWEAEVQKPELPPLPGEEEENEEEKTQENSDKESREEKNEGSEENEDSQVSTQDVRKCEN
eukprot:TRINITY_DN5386_c0_g1_i8.p2 TRINITY_DN5386_c0_g1~~TRINITY_DN5386_c0_g1_i8.p2  ORF type:complete len:345 (-),score=70.05 TRINITY_DN5386_c0_g1_i8:445-1479(-)